MYDEDAPSDRYERRPRHKTRPDLYDPKADKKKDKTKRERREEKGDRKNIKRKSKRKAGCPC